jgi:1-acyl-sn-glycerol-3-phosphate acyltransferase
VAKRQVGTLYPAARAVMVPTFRFLWNIEVEGRDNVPEHGPAIVAPNHVSVLDSFFVPVVLPRRITYVGKAEYLDSWKTKHLFPALGMIAIDRSGGDAARAALDAAAGLLDAGELFGIYPEGTRSRDGILHRGHTGVARLALRTGAPILPVGIQGTREVQPPGARRPQPWHTVRVRIGRPIDVGRYQARAGDRLVLRQITDELMYEIRELSGQRYVDEYATRRSETLPTAAVPVSTAGQQNGRNHVHGDGDVELSHSGGTVDRRIDREVSTIGPAAPASGGVSG